MRRARGFTLIELIVVIVVIGILSVGTAQFIRNSSEGYASTVERTELGAGARLALERLSRELRNALPNSIRVSGTCIEFIEAAGGAEYLEIPVGTAATTLASGPFTGIGDAGGLRIAVFPDTAAAIYGLDAPGPVSPPIADVAPAAGGGFDVTLDAAHAFAVESPQRRLYLIGEPVSFCVHDGRLWRYADYGFNAAQPEPLDLPAAMPQRALLGEGVSAPSAPFTITGATLGRNAIVRIDLIFGANGTSLSVDHLVHLRNVP